MGTEERPGEHDGAQVEDSDTTPPVGVGPAPRWCARHPRPRCRAHQAVACTACADAPRSSPPSVPRARTKPLFGGSWRPGMDVARLGLAHGDLDEPPRATTTASGGWRPSPADSAGSWWTFPAPRSAWPTSAPLPSTSRQGSRCNVRGRRPTAARSMTSRSSIPACCPMCRSATGSTSVTAASLHRHRRQGQRPSRGRGGPRGSAQRPTRRPRPRRSAHRWPPPPTRTWWPSTPSSRSASTWSPCHSSARPTMSAAWAPNPIPADPSWWPRSRPVRRSTTSPASSRRRAP